MKILITGNMGYVGPSVVRQFRQSINDAEIVGYDNGYFAHCLTTTEKLPETQVDHQFFGDVRNLSDEHLRGVDAVVHLAAISNDPMGKRFEAVTKEINQDSSVRIAKLCAKNGVKNFVFASSCSMYGQADGGARKESDPTNPLTAYARSKIGTEEQLAAADLGELTVTCLRFATACGMSDRLRLDLVLNDFVACAVSSGTITVLSDGSPWRPLIDVRDMARAIDWGASRTPDNGGKLLSVNAGSDVWNYQVKDLAHAVAEIIPGTNVSINTDAPPDKRSYKVDFSLFKSLAPNHQPNTSLSDSIARLKAGLESIGFTNGDFRDSDFMRLKVLESHMSGNRLSEDLRWKN